MCGVAEGTYRRKHLEHRDAWCPQRTDSNSNKHIQQVPAAVGKYRPSQSSDIARKTIARKIKKIKKIY